MSASLLEVPKQRLTAKEQTIAVLEQQVQSGKGSNSKSARTLSEAQRIENEDVNSQKMSQRERIMALWAKLKPISQEDAAIINNAIMDAREASIVHDLPA